MRHDGNKIWLEKLGDHPGVVLIGVVAGLITIIAFFLSLRSNDSLTPDDKGVTDTKVYKAPAKKVEQQKIRPSNGEAACYDEATFKSLVASLQKTKERHARNLINIVERDQHRQKLMNDFNHLVAQGASTESCILQQLGLVSAFYNDQL